MEFIIAKEILSKIQYDNSHWFGTDYNMNLYRGCCHGCIYCDSRSNCYNIIDFDRVRIKKDCIPILEKQLKSKRHSGVIQIGAMSDTYNPFEKKYEVTREALKLIDKYGFGVAIATKSDLILRDIDILKNINTHSPVIVKFSITCGDDNLSKVINAGMRYSVPTLGVCAVGKDMERTDRFFKLATRIIAEMGCQMVKTYNCENFEEVVAACPVPIVVAGGKKLAEKDALTLAYDVISKGARGVDMGRNIFQSQHPVEMAQAVHKVVHEGFTDKEAYEFYEDLIH